MKQSIQQPKYALGEKIYIIRTTKSTRCASMKQLATYVLNFNDERAVAQIVTIKETMHTMQSIAYRLSHDDWPLINEELLFKTKREATAKCAEIASFVEKTKAGLKKLSARR